VKSASAVIDASVVVRATVEQDGAAQDWVQAVASGKVAGHVPDLIWLEYANALTRCVRQAVTSAEEAREMLELALQLPLTAWPLGQLAVAAFAVSVERGLSAYDASYVVLAEAHDATLVTADRRLATAYDRVELLA